MDLVIFYEKPFCRGNAHQRQLLIDAGFAVTRRDILSEAWTAASLRPFFGERPVAEWFNRAAPCIKRGELDPNSLHEDEALAAMIADPLLIRRPLMEHLGRKGCGFDSHALSTVLDVEQVSDHDHEACRSRHASPCPDHVVLDEGPDEAICP